MAAAGAAVVGAGALGALAASLILKPGPGIDKMVPNNAGLYATIYLDPSLPQKANLLRMAHHFPDLHTDQQLTQKLNATLDQALQSTGLSFTKDIQPWVGSRMTAISEFSSKPTGAALFDSHNDAAAMATLARFRTSREGKRLHWSDSTYQGIAVSIGTDTGTTLVYAYLDHTAILADSEGIVHDIIDTDKGKRGSLLQTAAYRATVALLPSDRLVLVYIDGQSLTGMLKSEVSKQGVAIPQVPESAWRQLAAFRGIGATLAAGPDGLSGDVEVKLDASKLDAATRAALTPSSRHSTLLSWVPQAAFGVVSSNGIKAGLQSAIDQASVDASTRDSLQQLGLLGSNGLIAHLTGDLAVEIESPAAKSIGAAVLIGTTDPAGMRVFLTKMATIAEFTQSGRLNTTATAMNESVYHGVTIASFPLTGLGVSDLAPSFAVTSGAAIIATSPAEIRSVIDAHAAGSTLARASTFASVKAATFADPQNFLYVDLSEATQALLAYVPAQDRQTYGSQIAGNLSPIRAVMIASQSRPDRLSERIFILIPQ